MVNDIVAAMVAEIMKDEVTKLHNEMHSLCEMQAAVVGPRETVFLLKGEIISVFEQDVKRNQVKPLHDSLMDMGVTYMRNRDKTNIDIKRITQGLTLLLRDCKTMQGVRDAIPNFLVSMTPGAGKYKRTREEAWTLRDRPMQLVQYEITVDLISKYLANRFI